MKIRTDFVTNSSSSSFTVELRVKLDNGKKLRFYCYEAREDYDEADVRESNMHVLTLYEFKSLVNARNDMRRLQEILNKISRYRLDDSVFEGATSMTKADMSADGEASGMWAYEMAEYARQMGIGKEKDTDYSGVQYLSFRRSMSDYVTIGESDDDDGKYELYYGSQSNDDILVRDGVLIWYRRRYQEDGTYTIPDYVTSIGDEAFMGCDLYEVIIPESVTSIGARAFSWCEDLETITIPASVKEIAFDAFEGCSDALTFLTPGDS